MLRAASLLATGTALGQIIQVLAAPLLTRIYSPAEFGGLAIFVGLLGPITVMACLRFEMAIPLPKRDSAAYQVVGLAILSLIAITILTATLTIDSVRSLLGKSGEGVMEKTYWLLPIGVFLGGLYQLSSMWAVRKRSFGVIAKTRVQQGIGSAGTQVLLGFFKLGSIGLIAGQIAGQAIGLTRLTGSLIRDYRQKKIGAISLRGLSWAFQRYQRFFKYDALASLLNTAGAQAPSILFAKYFSPEVAGAYILSVRLLSAPITLVGKALIQAMLPDVVAARYNGTLPPMVSNLRRFITTLSLGPFLVVALLAPLLFGHIFGPKWEGAGNVAAWTALWVAFQFTYSPLSVVLLAVEAQKMNLILQIISFLTRMFAIYLCHAYGYAVYSVIAYSVISAVFYMCATVCVEWRAGVELIRAATDAIGGIFRAVIIASPVALSLVIANAPWVAILSTTISVALWLFYIQRDKSEHTKLEQGLVNS